MKTRSLIIILAALALVAVAAGCAPDPTATPVPTVTPMPSATSIPPTQPAPPTIPVEPEEQPTVAFSENLAAAMAKLQVPHGDAVALVNGQPIAANEFTQYMRLRLHTLDAQYPTDWRQAENDIVLAQAGSMVLDQLVDMEVLRQEAATEGIEIPAESVEILKTQVISQVPSSGEFADWDAYKTELGIEESTVERVLEDSLILQELMAAKAAPEMVPQVHAQHILVDTEELAQEILDQLEDGADFSALAIEHSTDPGSGPNGGDLGWFPRGMMVAPFEEAAFSLEPGEISGIVQSDFGYHIIKVIESGLHPLDAALAEQANMQAFTDWFSSIRESAEVERLIYAETAMP